MLEVLILAAGRGRRLRPLTDSTPKALLQVGAESLIERHLRRLAAQGFGEVVINLAWLGEQIRAQLGDGRRFGLRIRYSEEPAGALETGGGIARALRQLRGDPFLFRRRAFDAFDATTVARFPLLPVIERAIAGGRAGGQIHRGQWLDVGTPERLAEARRRAGEPRR